MRNINSITCQLLNCWYFDIKFLDELMEAYNIEVYLDDICMNYWTIDNLNIIIYEVYNEIKDMFLKENEEKIKSLWFNSLEFEIWNEYEIFTNYLDSHLRFNDDKLSEIYEDWRKH